jgi:small subunit ribosomal protein S2
MKDLLSAGVHFGHQTRRWNPKMERFIFGERSGVYIIDLEKTHRCIKDVQRFLIDLTSKGETILFVGTKPQARKIISEEAERCGMYYVNERWLGGTLTNFQTIRRSVARYEEINRMRVEGVFDFLTKKERAELEREAGKLTRYLRGILSMKKLPGVLFLADPTRDRIAVLEAKKLKIPVIAIADTNCNPEKIDFPLPGNDDAIRSITLLTRVISDAAKEGQEIHLKDSGVSQEKEEKSAVKKAEEGVPAVSVEEKLETKEVPAAPTEPEQAGKE